MTVPTIPSPPTKYELVSYQIFTYKFLLRNYASANVHILTNQSRAKSPIQSEVCLALAQTSPPLPLFLLILFNF